MNRFSTLSACLLAVTLFVAQFASTVQADEAEQVATINSIGRSAEVSAEQGGILVAALEDDSSNVRRRAALALAKHGKEVEGAAKRLIATLGDKDASVRAAAAYALGRVAPENADAAKALAKSVTDPAPVVQRASILALRASNVDRELVRPALLKALESGDPNVVAAALQVFASLGDAVIDDLNRALAHDDANYWASLVIQEMGPAAAATVEPLTKVLSNEEPEERLQAILALAAIGEKAKPAGKQLAAILKNDEFEGARFASAYALGKIGAKGVADDLLEESTKSELPLLRLTSAWALAELNPNDDAHLKTASKVILDGLKSDDPTLSRLSARLLVESHIPPEASLPVVTAMLEKADPATIEHVIDAVASQGAKALPRVKRALENEVLRLKALKVVQRIGPEAAGATEAILPLLKSEDDDVRREALFAIAAISPDTGEVADAVGAAYMAEKVRENRLAAIYAAGKIGPPAKQFVPHLKKLSTIPDDEQARVAALWALTRIAPDDQEVLALAVPAMADALGKADRPVIKIELAHTLADLGAKASGAKAALEMLKTDPDAGVREAAIAALEAIGE